MLKFTKALLMLVSTYMYVCRSSHSGQSIDVSSLPGLEALNNPGMLLILIHRNMQKLILLFLMVVHCIVIFSYMYKHHMVMGVSRTVIIMLLRLFILAPNCE